MSVARQHAAVLESAGVLDDSERAKVRVEGPDRVAFLHSMISHDVEKLEENRGRYATLLTHNGKLICDFHFYRLRESILIDLAPGRGSVLVEALNRFIIMDDVRVVEASRLWDHLSVQGPRAGEILGEIFAGTTLPAEPHEVGSLPNGQGLVVNKPELAETGYDLLLPGGSGQAVRDDLLSRFRSRGVLAIGSEARNVLRLERGIPWFGVDMDESNYPMEAGLEQAISLNKGCFVGQEVVAKATYVGGVRRRLSRLVLAADSPVPAAGAEVFRNEKKVGAVTSAVRSLRLERPIAFAYLIQALARAGDQVTVESDGTALAATVVESFLDESV